MGGNGKWLLSLFLGKLSSKFSQENGMKKTSQSKSKRWRFKRTTNNKSKDINEDRNSGHEHLVSIAAASRIAADAAMTAANAAAAVACLSNGSSPQLAYRLVQREWAVICIQTAFRGYLARKALRALKALVRLQALVRGHIVRKQTDATLRCIQSLLRVQERACAQRSHHSEGRTISQKKAKDRRKHDFQFQQHEEGWCDSKGSLEEFQAKMQQRQQAAEKRERAMAYAVSSQKKRLHPTPTSEAFIQFEPDKETWSWVWLEKWMTKQLWEDESSGTARKTGEMDSGKWLGKTQSDLTDEKMLLSRGKMRRSSSSLRRLQRSDSCDNLLPISGYDAHSFSLRPPDRRAFSNPKQRPGFGESCGIHMQGGKRIIAPCPNLKTFAIEKLQSLPRTRNGYNQ